MNGPYMDDFFAVEVQQNGAAVAKAGRLNCTGAITATKNTATGATDLYVPPATAPTTAQVLAALAATTSPLELNGEAITSVSQVELVNGATLYNTTAETSSVGGFAILEFPLASGQIAWVHIAMVGITSAPAVAKFERSFFAANQLGTINVFDEATIGVDFDSIGLSSPIGMQIDGGGTNAQIGCGGKAATDIQWSCAATVLVKEYA